MDSRTAAHVLTQIGALLELAGKPRFKSRAYQLAAKAVLALDIDDLAPLDRSGALAMVRGVGPATLAVLRDLIATGESQYFEQLRESTPEGLLDMARIPGLGTAKIHQIHQELDIDSLQELEEAARDGRLAKLKGFGPKTAEKLLKGIAFLRETGALVLYPHAYAEARRLVNGIREHPGVACAEIAGALRRRREIIRDIDIVAACTTPPAKVAAAVAQGPGVRDVVGVSGPSVAIRYVDGTLLDLHCVPREDFAVALWRATGSVAHVELVMARAAGRGLAFDGDRLLGPGGEAIALPDEAALYHVLGLSPIPPELREGCGELEAAEVGELPHLLEYGQLRGVLHCHSEYSDGHATIAEMAAAARARGWSYVGISDHSQSAFYAGGVSREQILAQHEEIEALNAGMTDVRVLKGIEADILADGSLDYDRDFLSRFDYVIGSVHSRFGMDGAQMTARVLRALDDPHMTILGHPTGRLLLTREPYAIDIDAVLEKAGEVGVAVELNADPHRLDLDWRLLRKAKAHGALIEIGPDAHSLHGLDNVEIGVGIARKGWLEAGDVLNARGADEVVAFARGRRGDG
jgi:DNA polymerase (family 10)